MLARGSAGVGAIHQALVEAGEPVAADELAAGAFGPSTEAAVRDFQARHVGPGGHALSEDGVVGPATEWALEHPNGAQARYTAPGWRYELSSCRAAVRRVLEVAVGEIGVTEQPDGSNSGPRVDVYTQPERGIQWCAAFVSWCYRRSENGSPFGTILSAYKFAEWGRQKGGLLGIAALPSPGDVFVIIRGDLHGHVGLVAGLTMDGRLCTVEGNSGNAVRGLIRTRSTLSAIVRPIPIT